MLGTKGKRNKNKKEISCSDIWNQYENGVSYLRSRQYYDKSDRAFRFFNGDQWSGVEAGGEDLPVYNFIKPVVKYKTAVVCTNAMEIVYLPVNVYDEEYSRFLATCEALNAMAKNTWERLKLSRRLWDDVRDSAIGGNSYRFFLWNNENECIETETINQTNIIFADEQQPDIQKQSYIIIAQRDTVKNIRDIAKNVYKCTDEVVESIVGDNDTDNELGDYAKTEVVRNPENEKCTILTKLCKTGKGIEFTRSTKHAVIQETTVVSGAKLYPIAALCWEPQKGSARGQGEVLPLIPNQVEVNKNLYRSLLTSKLTSYPRLVYNEEVITNPESLDNVGLPIAISGSTVSDIKSYIGYVEPSHIASDAHVLTNNLISTTRELAGAGDIATGQVDPEKASGQAILAVQKSSEQPVSDSIEGYKQYIEDIALIWYDLWCAYFVNGFDVPFDKNGVLNKVRVPASELSALSVSVRIDVSPTSPYDKYAQERSLENLLAAKHITFEEYIDLLPVDAVMPKQKLTALIESRKKAAEIKPPTDGEVPGMQAPGQSPPEGAPGINEIPQMQIPAQGTPQSPMPDISAVMQ